MRGIAVDSSLHALANTGEWGDLCLIFLCVVVTRNPVGCVVARHGKLRVLFLNDEIVEIRLLWEFIAQSHAVVVDTESEDDVSVGSLLIKVHSHLVVVVADRRRFSPYGFPRLVEC